MWSTRARGILITFHYLVCTTDHRFVLQVTLMSTIRLRVYNLSPNPIYAFTICLQTLSTRLQSVSKPFYEIYLVP
jgi:hypothetical protein